MYWWRHVARLHRTTLHITRITAMSSRAFSRRAQPPDQTWKGHRLKTSFYVFTASIARCSVGADDLLHFHGFWGACGYRSCIKIRGDSVKGFELRRFKFEGVRLPTNFQRPITTKLWVRPPNVLEVQERARGRSTITMPSLATELGTSWPRRTLRTFEIIGGFKGANPPRGSYPRTWPQP